MPQVERHREVLGPGAGGAHSDRPGVAGRPAPPPPGCGWAEPGEAWLLVSAASGGGEPCRRDSAGGPTGGLVPTHPTPGRLPLLAEGCSRQCWDPSLRAACPHTGPPASLEFMPEAALSQGAGLGVGKGVGNPGLCPRVGTTPR